MKSVTRLFLISTGWTLAMYIASNFIGAWFWDIGTGLRPIIVFYTILFVVMVVSFGLASKIRGHLSSSTLMALGIVLNALYLAVLLGLKANARHFYIPLAILEGLSASFYWLGLFVLASSWVEEGQEAWYNGWTGTIEAVLGLVAPPLSGWIISAMPGLNGYRTVFFIAFVSLLGCAWLILSGRRGSHDPEPRSRVVLHELPEIPGWRRLGWSFWALGMRDGMYFFVPNLLLYIVTHNTILLGLFMAMQAALEGLIFWALTRWPGPLARGWGLWLATGIGLLALLIIVTPLNVTTIFFLGIVIAVCYPSFKVALESSALTLITRYSRHETDRIQLTGAKEVWINSGRLISLLTLLTILTVIHAFRVGDFRWILGLWALIPVAIYITARPQAEVRGGEIPH